MRFYSIATSPWERLRQPFLERSQILYEVGQAELRAEVHIFMREGHLLVHSGPEGIRTNLIGCWTCRRTFYVNPNRVAEIDPMMRNHFEKGEGDEQKDSGSTW